MVAVDVRSGNPLAARVVRMGDRDLLARDQDVGLVPLAAADRLAIGDRNDRVAAIDIGGHLRTGALSPWPRPVAPASGRAGA